MPRLTTLRIAASAVLLVLIAHAAAAGERAGVLEALARLPSTWTDAQPKVEFTGSTDSGLVLGTRVQFTYSTSSPGYVALIDVTSHGEMTLLNVRGVSAGAATTGTTDTFVVTPPLGTETVYFIFSKAPLDRLFSGGAQSRALGEQQADAEAFVRDLGALAAGGAIASRQIAYEIVGKPGQTEYTTRGIIHEMAEANVAAKNAPPGSKPPVASFPTRIQFEFNSDRITPAGGLALDVFGELLARPEARSLPVTLEGHTDDVGSDEYNYELSLRRATAVRGYLVKSFGIDPARVTVAAFGKRRPQVPNVDDASRARNRRVEFVLPAVVLQDAR